MDALKNMLNFRRAQQLVALADERSFTRAAYRLRMTQPALSRAVALIEEECGLRLFERGRGGVELTVAGARLVSDIRQILGQLSLVEQNLLMQGKGEAGTVRFAIGPLAASHLMDDLLTECVRRWPTLHLASAVLDTPSIAAGVMQGDLDFGICSRGTLDPDPALRIMTIGHMRMGFFVRRGHPLAKRGSPVSWDDIARFPRAAGYNRPLRDGRAIRPFAPLESTIECDDYEALRRVTLRTDAIWLTSGSLIRKDSTETAFVEIQPQRDPAPQLAEFSAITLKGRSQIPAVHHVIDAAARLMEAG
ncbi:MAG: LysR family transcriptional regulator [Novosphingobium sp.]|nr:LysR family transcriptional regulator [Novosphingobium sp.]